GLEVTQTVAEVGSGMNGSRRKLRRLLADRTVDCIVGEDRDRLAGVGRRKGGAGVVGAGGRGAGGGWARVGGGSGGGEDGGADLALRAAVWATVGKDPGGQGAELRGPAGGREIVIFHQAFRFALDPTVAQRRALASHSHPTKQASRGPRDCGAARFAFNWGL